MEIKSTPEYLNINGSLYQTRISSKFKKRKPYRSADPRIILSFIPSTVIDIFIQAGQDVKKGDILIILDAMKMQNRLKSPVEGLIKRIHMKKGDRVPKGVLLVEIE